MLELHYNLERTKEVTFPQFDFQIINDVILHLRYTAEEDEVLNEKVEEQNEKIQGELLKYLKENPLIRMLGLRHIFSYSFHQILHNPINTQEKIEIKNMKFPFFLQGFFRSRNIEVIRG